MWKPKYGNVSPYFKAKTSARGDAYLVCEAIGHAMHISLHDSLDHWSVKTRRAGEEDWTRKPITFAEMNPHLVRAFSIVIPGSAAAYPRPDKKVTWIPRDETDLGESIQFTLFVQERFSPDLWPGKNVMDNQLVARLPLNDDGSRVLTIVAHQITLEPFTQTFDMSGSDGNEELRRQMVEGLTDPRNGLILWDTLEDGSSAAILLPGAVFQMRDQAG